MQLNEMVFSKLIVHVNYYICAAANLGKTASGLIVKLIHGILSEHKLILQFDM